MNNYLSFFISLLFFASCNKVVEKSSDSFKVSGTIVQNGSPLSKAVISIDDKLNWQTQTALDGSFELKDVTKGNHTLKVNSVDNSGGFVEKKSEITVNGDVNLDGLKLPKSIVLNDPFNVTISSMGIRWNRTDALDFREYKLYRHLTSGLDETTGELIHVSTSIADTVFTINDLNPLQVYYYRVYVMNEYGRLGGSNIVHDTTKQINLIWNGNFESNENLLSWWSGFNGIGYQFDNSVVKNGIFSLCLHADTTIAPNTTNIIVGAGLIKYFNSSEIEMIVGRTYKFSGWVKTKGDTRYGYGFSGYIGLGGHASQAAVYFNGGNDYAQFILPGNTDWTYFEKTFVKTASSGSGTILVCCISEYAWFDDLKLEIVK